MSGRPAIRPGPAGARRRPKPARLVADDGAPLGGQSRRRRTGGGSAGAWSAPECARPPWPDGAYAGGPEIVGGSAYGGSVIAGFTVTRRRLQVARLVRPNGFYDGNRSGRAPRTGQ